MNRLAVRDDHALERQVEQGAERGPRSLLEPRRRPDAELARHSEPSSRRRRRSSAAPAARPASPCARARRRARGAHRAARCRARSARAPSRGCCCARRATGRRRGRRSGGRRDRRRGRGPASGSRRRSVAARRDAPTPQSASSGGASGSSSTTSPPDSTHVELTNGSQPASGRQSGYSRRQSQRPGAMSRSSTFTRVAAGAVVLSPRSCTKSQPNRPRTRNAFTGWRAADPAAEPRQDHLDEE